MPWSWIRKLRSPNQNTNLDRERGRGGRMDSKRKQLMEKEMRNIKEWVTVPILYMMQRLWDKWSLKIFFKICHIFKTSVWVSWSLYSVYLLTCDQQFLKPLYSQRSVCPWCTQTHPLSLWRTSCVQPSDSWGNRACDHRKTGGQTRHLCYPERQTGRDEKQRNHKFCQTTLHCSFSVSAVWETNQCFNN